MKNFLDEDFLLTNETAKVLFHQYAKEMPICDFHCHLSPKEIAEDKQYKNITELWLGGDHYKWRVLRANGVTEDLITGHQDDKDKFLAWAKTVPELLGNPLYHWTHLELQRYFGIQTLLSEDTALEIFEACNKKLQSKEITARSLIQLSNVKTICTTDDPLDSLEYHEQIMQDTNFETKVVPGFRPDKAIHLEQEGFGAWVERLEVLYGHDITSLEQFLDALETRIEHFDKHGCFISDHALDIVEYRDSNYEEVNIIFQKGLAKIKLSAKEKQQYKGYLLLFFGKHYKKRNWTQQYHIGALRNNSSRMFERLGPDTGYDSILDVSNAQALSKLLNQLDQTDELPQTILYGLNPSDNEVLATMAGNFQGGGIVGKMQFGSAWWFNDQKDGMERQMIALSQTSLLSRFVGMVTDSRSFLSYTRHEYFRRILCNMIGRWVEDGEYPNHIEYLGKIVQNICYYNAANYFNKQ